MFYLLFREVVTIVNNKFSIFFAYVFKVGLRQYSILFYSILHVVGTRLCFEFIIDITFESYTVLVALMVENLDLTIKPLMNSKGYHCDKHSRKMLSRDQI